MYVCAIIVLCMYACIIILCMCMYYYVLLSFSLCMYVCVIMYVSVPLFAHVCYCMCPSLCVYGLLCICARLSLCPPIYASLYVGHIDIVIFIHVKCVCVILFCPMWAVSFFLCACITFFYIHFFLCVCFLCACYCASYMRVLYPSVYNREHFS